MAQLTVFLVTFLTLNNLTFPVHFCHLRRHTQDYTISLTHTVLFTTVLRRLTMREVEINFGLVCRFLKIRKIGQVEKVIKNFEMHFL